MEFHTDDLCDCRFCLKLELQKAKSLFHDDPIKILSFSKGVQDMTRFEQGLTSSFTELVKTNFNEVNEIANVLSTYFATVCPAQELVLRFQVSSYNVERIFDGTIGLCAQAYPSSMRVSKMGNWIKLEMSDLVPLNEWQNAWARIFGEWVKRIQNPQPTYTGLYSFM